MKDLKVKDVMTSLVVTIRPSDSIHEAAAMLARNNVSGAPVVADGKVIGLISESDLITAAMPPVSVDHGMSVLDALAVLGRARPKGRHEGKKVADVMAREPITVLPDVSVWKAALQLERWGIKRLPVVDDNGYLVGIVSRADLVRVLAREDSEIEADVLESIRVLGEEDFTDLDVTVVNGIARLSGMADTRSTHELAVNLAAQVPGVIEVVDRLDHEWDDKKAGFIAPLKDPKDPFEAGIYVRAAKG